MPAIENQVLNKAIFEKYICPFYERTKQTVPHRYKSWEYCYKYFSDKQKAINSDDEVLDLAALNLAFYLASWGMYRGSSFLLQTDYTVHKKSIKIIMEAYHLKDITITRWTDDHTSQLFKMIHDLNAYYRKVKEKIDNTGFSDETNHEEKNISDTLLTKILLGTLGITPAYDRYFKNGLTLYNMVYPEKKIPTTLNEKNFNKLIAFCKEYSESLNLDLSLSIDDKIKYPFMKKIDMFFWNIGIPWAIPDHLGNYFVEGKKIADPKNNPYIKIYDPSANNDCFEKKYFERSHSSDKITT